jgi:hypothetical protein
MQYLDMAMAPYGRGHVHVRADDDITGVLPRDVSKTSLKMPHGGSPAVDQPSQSQARTLVSGFGPFFIRNV